MRTRSHTHKHTDVMRKSGFKKHESGFKKPGTPATG